jgi:hypothetical protein
MIQYTKEEIDDLVDEWHGSETKMSLHEFLGMTEEEYNRWILDPKSLQYPIKEEKQMTELEAVVEAVNKLNLLTTEAGLDTNEAINEGSFSVHTNGDMIKVDFLELEIWDSFDDMHMINEKTGIELSYFEYFKYRTQILINEIKAFGKVLKKNINNSDNKVMSVD